MYRYAMVLLLLSLPVAAEAQLKPNQAQLLTRGTELPGIFGADQATGFASVTGDFNGDDWDDLAVGVPFYDPGPSFQDAGSVVVSYGGPTWLDRMAGHEFIQSLDGVPGALESGDQFGEVLAVADIDGDGYDDLLIGVPREDIGSIVDAGAVFVLFGGPSGLSSTDSFFISDASPVPFGNFGQALATWPAMPAFKNIVFVGVPGDEIDSVAAGSVQIWHPEEDRGLEWVETIHQEDYPGPPILGSPNEDGDGFGSTLAAGKMRQTTQFPSVDLAIGSPTEDGGEVLNFGLVWVFTIDPTPGSFSIDQAQFLSQNVDGFSDTAETNDKFGETLAALHLVPTSGLLSLVIGVPSEDLGGMNDAGMVHIVRDFGLLLGEVATLDASMVGQQAAFAEFGAAIAGADFNGDHSDDLVIGEPFYREPGVEGRVWTFTTNELGLPSDPQHIDSDQEGFGLALTTGRFSNRDRFPDLMIGHPLYSGTQSRVHAGGVVWVPNGKFFSNGFESGGFHGWDHALTN